MSLLKRRVCLAATYRTAESSWLVTSYWVRWLADTVFKHRHLLNWVSAISSLSTEFETILWKLPVLHKVSGVSLSVPKALGITARLKEEAGDRGSTPPQLCITKTVLNWTYVCRAVCWLNKKGWTNSLNIHVPATVSKVEPSTARCSGWEAPVASQLPEGAEPSGQWSTLIAAVHLSGWCWGHSAQYRFVF